MSKRTMRFTLAVLCLALAISILAVPAMGAKPKVLLPTFYTSPNYPPVETIIKEKQWWNGINLWYWVRFLAKHPDVDIELTTFDIWSGPGPLMAGLTAGTAPAFYPGDVVAYAKQNMFADITDLVKASPYMKSLSPALTEQLQIDGRFYAVPEMFYNNRVVVFRTDWVKEAGLARPKAGWDMDDFAALAKKLTNKSKNRWGAILLGGGDDNTPGLFTRFAANFGFLQQMVVPDTSGKYTWRAAFNSPDTVRALELYQDLATSGAALTGTSYDWSQMWTDLWGGKPGKGGMFIMGSHDAAARLLISSGPTGDAPKGMYGIAPMPQGPEGLNLNTLSSNFYGINPTIPKEAQKVAFDWLMTVFAGEYRQEMIRVMRDLYGFNFDYQIPASYDVPTPPGMGDWRDVLEKADSDAISYVEGMPLAPLANRYGAIVSKRQGLIQTLVAPIQKALTDKKADPKKLLDEAADIANKTVLNYKEKDVTAAEIKAYFKALDAFYKKNYPEYYNKWFSKLYSEYTK